jgi:phage shock protein A
MRERLDQLPDEPLSSRDRAEFRANLDQLKAELTEQLKRETHDRDTLKRRIDELGRDIEFLKTTLESMTRRHWVEAFIVRLQRWKSNFSLQPILRNNSMPLLMS